MFLLSASNSPMQASFFLTILRAVERHAWMERERFVIIGIRVGMVLVRVVSVVRWFSTGVKRDGRSELVRGVTRGVVGGVVGGVISRWIGVGEMVD